jgi:outer membrane protein assembly factor BamB
MPAARRSTALLLFAFLAPEAFGQPPRDHHSSPAATPLPQVVFCRTYGGAGDETGNAIVELRDGGLLIAGYSTVHGADHEYFVRTTASGDTLWTRTSTEPGEDSAWDARLAGDGSITAVGFTTGHGADGEDVLLTNLTDAGQVRWRRTLGGPGEQRAWGLATLPNGDYVIAGQTRLRAEAPWSGFIARVAADGRPIWTRTLDRGTEARLFGVTATDRGLVFTGTRRAPEGHRRMWVVAVDGSGTVEWEREFGGPRSLVGHGILQNPDGTLLVTGYGDAIEPMAAPSPAVAGPHREEAVLQALSAHGDSLWTARADGTADERTIFSIRSARGKYLSIGYRRIHAEDDWDMLLLATDGHGVKRWAATFGGPAPDRGVAALEKRDGTVLLTGSIDNGPGRGNDVALIELRLGT